METIDKSKIKYTFFKCIDCGKEGKKPACVRTGEYGYFGCCRCLSENIENIAAPINKPKQVKWKRKKKLRSSL